MCPVYTWLSGLRGRGVRDKGKSQKAAEQHRRGGGKRVGDKLWGTDSCISNIEKRGLADKIRVRNRGIIVPFRDNGRFGDRQ